jgi:hypothetical protein
MPLSSQHCLAATNVPQVHQKTVTTVVLACFPVCVALSREMQMPAPAP